MKSRPNLLTSLILVCLSILIGNCYFNPAVQLVVNPEISEDADPVVMLGIASALAGPRTVQITGQVVDANGVAVAGGTLTILSRTNQLSGLTDTITLNEGGRFYLTLSIGETTIRVDQSGVELFTFKLSVLGPGVASIIEKSLAGPNAINLEFYTPEFIPIYFDLVSSTPYDNATFTTWPTLVTITFSENLETPSNMQSFLDANVITNPAISLDGSSSFIMNNVLQIYNSSSFSIGTNTYTLRSEIKSSTGKSLAPRTITYICNSPCNGS